jgi:hypothetical protein
VASYAAHYLFAVAELVVPVKSQTADLTMATAILIEKHLSAFFNI